MVCTVRQNPSKNKLKLECISLLLSLESLYFAYKHNFFVLSGSQFHSVGDHSNPPPWRQPDHCGVHSETKSFQKFKTEDGMYLLYFDPTPPSRNSFL